MTRDRSSTRSLRSDLRPEALGLAQDTPENLQPHRLRRVTTTIGGAILLITAANAWLLVNNEPPADSVSEIQYQSLLLSISAATYYDDTGIQLVVDRSPSAPMRYEDLAVDDVGYAIGLGLATRFGVTDFSEETRSYVRLAWELEDSRTFMYETVRHEIHYLNRVLFACVATLISIAVLASAWVAADRLSFWCNAVALAFILFVTGQIAPHLVPRTFVTRLHVHGVIASLVLLGTASILALRGSLMSPPFVGTKSIPESMSNMAMAFFAGLTLSTVMLVRRAEGMVWLMIAAITVVLLFIRALRTERKKRALAMGLFALGFAFLVGYAIPGYSANNVISHRERSVRNLVGELQPPIHPIYHSTLIGISRSPRNSLGIASEADVVALVQSKTGFPGNAFNAGYEDVSQDVYFEYVSEDPGNYLAVLTDNVDETMEFVLLNLGLQVHAYARALLIGVMIVGLLVASTVMVRRGGGYRFLACTLWAYLLLAFVIAVATTSAAAYGPTIGIILVVVSGIAAWLAVQVEATLGEQFR